MIEGISDPSEYTKMLFDVNKARSFIPTVPCIQLSGICNLQCRMCTGSNDSKSPKAFMALDLYRHILAEFKKLGTEYLCLTTGYGEPFLHPQIFEFMEETIAAGFQIMISTNATLLDETSARRLSEMTLYSLQVSFSGYDEESYQKIYRRGCFQTVVQNIALLKKLFNNKHEVNIFRVNGVVYDGDPVFYERTVRFLQELGLSESEILMVLPFNRAGKRHIGSFHKDRQIHSYKEVDQLSTVLCQMLMDNPGIYYDGVVTACGCMDSLRELVVGDIRREDMISIRHSPQFQMLVDSFMRGDIQNIPLCARCDIPYGTKKVLSFSDKVSEERVQ